MLSLRVGTIMFWLTMVNISTAFKHNAIRSIRRQLSSTRIVNMVSTLPPPTEEKRGVVDQIGAAGIASAAVIAAAAVNSAVGMRTIAAPDAERTYVYRDGASLNRAGKIDEFGLPLIYDKDLIQAYWKSQGNALTQRWTEFLGYSVPYLTKVITILVTGGSGELKKNGGVLARDARIIFEKLVRCLPWLSFNIFSLYSLVT
jgi:hypothetical protein